MSEPQEVDSVTLPKTSTPGATVHITGDAYRALTGVKQKLLNDASDKGVVMLALGLLQLAQGKTIQIVEPDGSIQVVNLWKP